MLSAASAVTQPFAGPPPAYIYTNTHTHVHTDNLCVARRCVMYSPLRLVTVSSIAFRFAVAVAAQLLPAAALSDPHTHTHACLHMAVHAFSFSFFTFASLNAFACALHMASLASLPTALPQLSVAVVFACFIPHIFAAAAAAAGNQFVFAQLLLFCLSASLSFHSHLCMYVSWRISCVQRFLFVSFAHTFAYPRLSLCLFVHRNALLPA